MTSRERVLAAIQHQEPDRVPIDLGGMRSTGIMAVAYHRLKEYLGINTGETFHYDLVQSLAQPEDEILERFGVDVVDLARVFLTEPEERKPWTLVDGSPATVPVYYEPEPDGAGGWLIRGDEGQIIGVAPQGQPYITQTYWPLSGGVTDEALANLPHHMQQVTWARASIACAPWYRPMTDEWLAEVARRAQKLREETDYAIMVGFGCNFWSGDSFCGALTASWLIWRAIPGQHTDY